MKNTSPKYHVNNNGTEFWLDSNDNFHRTDGPAVMYKDGCYHWYVHGAVIESNSACQSILNLSDEEMLILILKYGNITW